MRFSNYLIVSALALLSLAGCSPDKDVTVAPSADNTNVFVLNEGLFAANGTGTITLFNKSTKAVTPDLFANVNGAGRRLGNVVQSMAVRDKRGYIVVNAADKVEVVSLPEFKSVGVVKGLNSPRYFLPISTSRAYVTQWGRDTLHRHGVIIPKVRSGIKIIDLITNSVVDSIATGDLPERLTLAGGKVFVANYGSNTVTVIDPATNRVTNTLTVGDSPNSFALDKNSRLWVLCGGFVSYLYDPNGKFLGIDYANTTAGSLYGLDPANPTSGGTSRIFASNQRVPVDIHANPAGDQLYFRATDATSYLGGVVRLGIADAALPSLTATPFIDGLFYGLGIDPADGTIYTGTGTFSFDKMARYQPNGLKIDETVVGAGPNGFVFF
ncbi:YVTN family beta-propeller protein [Hymenobacter sp. UYAg731]